MATLTMTQAEPGTASNGIELQSYPPSHTPSERKLGISDLEEIRQDSVPSARAVEVKQRWNSPKSNMWRVFATFWSFFVVGMNDGSYGVGFSTTESRNIY